MDIGYTLKCNKIKCKGFINNTSDDRLPELGRMLPYAGQGIFIFVNFGLALMVKKFVCVWGLRFITPNNLICIKVVPKVIGYHFCTPIIFKNPLKTSKKYTVYNLCEAY